MSILLNKTTGNNRVIFTFSNYAEGDTYLNIYNTYNQKEKSILLGINTSIDRTRYNEYIVPIEDFNTLAEGLYTYVITDAQTALCGALDTGSLKVIDCCGGEELIEFTPESDKDSFIVYDED